MVQSGVGPPLPVLQAPFVIFDSLHSTKQHSVKFSIPVTRT